jgi:HK97 family phage major capsid protein
VGFTVSGHATLLNNADKLVDVQHSLKSVYRNGALWLMNDTTCGKIRVLKDGDGNYLWRPGLTEGKPDSLLGKPVEYDDNLDDIGAGKFPLFFGNFKRAYLIIDRIGIRILRDPYTSKGNVLFYCTKRVGGGIVMFEALKALKISA